MSAHFHKVKNYLMELNLNIHSEDSAEELVMIDDEPNGIKNMVIDCEEPILILEQVIFPLPANANENTNLFRRLLQMNRGLVHGAFVLDEAGEKVLFRDTLQLDSLDLNELEGSINALSLGLAEFGDEILGLAQHPVT